MRPVRARVLALLTAVAVLLPAGAFARTQYYCRMMGRVVSACCCKAGPGHAADGPRIAASDCCERISSRAPAPPPGTRDARVTVTSAAALVATVPDTVYVPPAAREVTAPPPQARAPPALGPPLFIVHCALLT